MYDRRLGQESEFKRVDVNPEVQKSIDANTIGGENTNALHVAAEYGKLHHFNLMFQLQLRNIKAYLIIILIISQFRP